MVLQKSSGTAASLRKRQYNVYNIGARLMKLGQKKLPRWDKLLEVGESKYKNNTTIC